MSFHFSVVTGLLIIIGSTFACDALVIKPLEEGTSTDHQQSLVVPSHPAWYSDKAVGFGSHWTGYQTGSYDNN